MRLHLLGVPHTVTRSDFSHCAFTGKVLRFSPMLRAQGFEVVHYGVEGSESGATENVTLLSTDEHLDLLGLTGYNDHPEKMVGDAARDGAPVYRQFNHYLADELNARLAPGDAICCPFGLAHEAALRQVELVRSKDVHVVETGIGYADCFSQLRVYESEAWRHFVMGHEHRSGTTFDSPRREWVVPNYYNVREWPFVPTPDNRDRIVFMGRIARPKGLDIIPVMAEARPDLEFVICGQGDPEPWLVADNIRYEPPKQGRARAAFLGHARAIVCASRFVEPFCGVAVEAMLCGTPTITSDFGAFTETVENGVTGFRCRTTAQWIDALEGALMYDRAEVAQRTRARYSTERVGPQYAAVFRQLAEQRAA